MIFLQFALILGLILGPLRNRADMMHPSAGPNSFTDHPTKMLMQDAPSPSKIAWGRPQNGLRAGIQITSSGMLHLILENTGRDSIQVKSYVNSHERHYDWFKIVVQSVADGTTEEYRLLDSRNRSGLVVATLAGHGQLIHEIDFADWSHRHGAGPFPGSYKIRFTYEVNDGAIWIGKVTSRNVIAKIDLEGHLSVH